MANVLLIGLGGVGSQVVLAAKRMFDERLGLEGKVDCLTLDLGETTTAEGLTQFGDFSVRDAARTVEALSTRDEYFPKWWPTVGTGEPFKQTGAIGEGTQAAQIRPNGRLAYINNFQGVDGTIERFFEKQREAAPDEQASGAGRFFVFIISSLGGGTGAGILQDVAYACRWHMGQDRANHFVVGVFLDGTVVRKWSPGKTGAMGVATLTETEHWFTTPADYYALPYLESLVNPWSIRREAGAGHMNLAFLFQAENTEGWTLLGRKTGHVKQDYVQLVAGWLYTFLAGDLRFLAGQRRERSGTYLFENVLTRFLNQPGMLRDGRSHAYCAAGVSLLSVPVRKIGRYLTAGLLLNGFSAWQRTSRFNETAAAYLALRRLDQKLDQQLGDRCRETCEAGQRLVRQIHATRASLQRARGHKELLRAARSSHLDNCRDHWGPAFSEYRDQAGDAFNAILDTELAALDERVTDELSSGMHPSALESWLQELVRETQAARDDTAERAQRFAEEWDTRIQRQWALTRDANRYQRHFGWRALRDGVGAALVDLTARLHAVEAAEVVLFYQRFLGQLRSRLRAVTQIREVLDDLMDRAEETQAEFRERDWFLNEELLQENEHPLELEIGTDVRYVEEAQGRLVAYFERRSLENDSEDGGGIAGLVARVVARPVRDAEAQLLWPGLDELYRQAVEANVREERTREVRDVSAGGGLIQEQLRRLIGREFELPAERFLAEECSIHGALDSFLARRFAEAKEYRGASADRSLLDRFSSHFGSDGAHELMEKARARDVDQSAWKDAALGFLVARLARFAQPWWRPDSVEKGFVAEKHSEGGFEPDHTVVYAPNRRMRSALTKSLRQGMGVSPFPDPHSLAIATFHLGYPLYCFTGWEEDAARYRGHLEASANGTNVEPYHVDRRFYGEWSDDIAAREPMNQTQLRRILRLYLLAIGTDVLELRKSGNRARLFRFDGRTVARSLPKLLGKLKDDDFRKAVRLRVQNAIGETLAGAAMGRRPKQETVWRALAKAYDTHLSLEPPKTRASQEQYRLWAEAEAAGHIKLPVRKDDKPDIRGYLVPSTEEDFGSLAKELNMGA